MSLIVFAYPTDQVYLGFGLFDGALQEGINTGSRGPKTFFESSPADLFVIGEVGATWVCGTDADSGLPGRVGVGGWGHNGRFDRFDGSTESGTAGFYLVFDQALWRENPDSEDDEQGVAVFFQLGWADPDVSFAHVHVGGGFAWTGPISSRDDDVAGFGTSWVRFTDEPGSGATDDTETAFEVFLQGSADALAGCQAGPAIHPQPRWCRPQRRPGRNATR